MFVRCCAECILDSERPSPWSNLEQGHCLAGGLLASHLPAGGPARRRGSEPARGRPMEEAPGPVLRLSGLGLLWL